MINSTRSAGLNSPRALGGLLWHETKCRHRSIHAESRRIFIRLSLWIQVSGTFCSVLHKHSFLMVLPSGRVRALRLSSGRRGGILGYDQPAGLARVRVEPARDCLACASAGPLWTARNHPGRVGPRISSRAWLIQQEVTERTEKTSLLSTPGSISQLQGSNTSHKRGGARTLVEWHLDKPGSAGVPAGELAENCGKAPALPGGTRLS